jgi:nucleotide-binding universal stress UspA family protein
MNETPAVGLAADMRAERVVVGFDGSDHARVAVEWAADEAARRGTALDVLFAAHYTGLIGGPFGGAFGGSWLPESVAREAHNVAEAGARIARRRRPEVPATPVVYPGDAPDALVEESKSGGLVVVGARGRGELAALALGSVSTAVAAHAQSPVVVVRGGEAVAPEPRRPVVVGVDGTPASDDALRFAVAAARAGGAPLKIVGAWPSIRDDWTRAFWLAADPATDVDSTARQAAERVVAEAADRVSGMDAELKVQTYVRGGDPATVVVDVAGDDAALVVLGSRGHGALAGLVLGSVGHGVVHGARCPVAIVKHVATGPTSEATQKTAAGAG